MKASLILTAALVSATCALPAPLPKRAGDCTNQLINFDDSSIVQKDVNKIEKIANPFAGFNWDCFGFTTCPGKACNSFPAEVTKQFTAPRLALSEGLVGGLLNGNLVAKTSPKGSFELVDKAGSFDLGPFDVFDIIDLPEQVKLGAKEDMRVHLDCEPAGAGENVKLTIPFVRNKDSAGYSVTADMLQGKFVGLRKCTLSTTQVFFPFGLELEIPTESMGLDNLNVCVR